MQVQHADVLPHFTSLSGTLIFLQCMCNQAGVNPSGEVNGPSNRLAIWSGPASAATYQKRIAAFQTDRATNAAHYRDGSIASIDVNQSRGVGGVLSTAVMESVMAMRAGCRYTAPHVADGTSWLYAEVAARSSLCVASEGWGCVFDPRTFMPTESPRGSMARGAAGVLDISACNKQQADLKRHDLHRYQVGAHAARSRRRSA